MEHTKDLSNAYVIKAMFVSSILKGEINLFPNKDLLIGQEVMYGKHQNFADLVVLYNNRTYAIEIKAQNDNFRRLNSQIENYRKVFDYVYVLATQNHINALKDIDYQGVGIISIDNDAFKIVKRGRLQNKFSKEDILESVPVSYLTKKFVLKKSLSACAVRNELVKKNVTELKKTLFEYFNFKIEDKFKNFIEEKGEVVQYEDISMLSIINARVSK